jgi:hypothetical protein
VPERVSTNGAAPGASETDAPAADMTPGSSTTAEAPEAGATEAEAPAADMTSGSATTAEASGPPGATEAEAPAADMTPGSPAAAGASGTGATETEAPVSDMRPDPATTSPIKSPTTGGTGLKSGPVRSEVDAIDLLDHAGAPVLQRLVPVLGGGLLLVLIILLIRRLRAS